LAVPLAVFWLVAMMNAINFIDTADGLAGGISAIASFVLFMRSAWFGQDSIAVVPLALGASCLGFLTRNWYPSRVIFGASGALFLGYMLGAITLMGGVKIGTAFLVLAVPILDVAWVAYRRVSQGRSPFLGGDAEHVAHRLRRLGLSVPAIVLTLYAVCGLAGVAVLALHSGSPGIEKLYLAGGVVVGVFGGLALVAHLTTPPATPSDVERPHV
ncbi:MAG: UDP-GlcNAc:undecaprenyl-phosphate/decaprenyl-phosphate GlcNAc-phosphate transferase, partial [Chloroflexota bacterium]|nr:UDP-GlcNAc:undecaprenyl-phosphate/decaprenyl-phosphate GlcNAc-phosphate transferase [Chloroflexota bacterium]